jgi:hypothetical protein
MGKWSVKHEVLLGVAQRWNENMRKNWKGNERM